MYKAPKMLLSIRHTQTNPYTRVNYSLSFYQIDYLRISSPLRDVPAPFFVFFNNITISPKKQS